MKTLYSILLCGLLFCSSCTLKSEKNTDPPSKPNFLIFFIDDLRPELACYGESQIHSPNIDQIAEEGLRFNRAYCNIPVCGASRASLLTGVRPSPQRFVSYFTRADEDLPEQITLPEYFKNNGYYTVSMGKIFHHSDDSPESWCEAAWMPEPSQKEIWRDYVTPENIASVLANKNGGPSTEIAENAVDSVYKDGKTANAAVRKLQQLAKKEEPFMLWVGFQKPHLPFNAPSKYWDIYDRDEISIAKNPFMPINAPKESMHTWGELRAYDDIPQNGPVSDEKAAELIHGYYACVSYTDALIGQVLAELKNLDLDENTIVAVFGDHGWNLGEHGLWCKHCNYNTSLHVPLIIKIPGKTNGMETEGLTEFVDLYPTFADLAGLEAPKGTHGKSLRPLIDNPEMEWNEAVFSRYVLGNSIITENYIYSEYMRSRKDCTIVSNMLYDHRTDPDENEDISEYEEYIQLSDSLSSIMNKIHLGKE